MIKGGNYKRGSANKLREFGCCYYCHLGVLTHTLGSSQSYRPYYFNCLSAPQVGSINQMYSVTCFYWKHVVITYLEDFELLRLHLSDGDQGGPLPSPLEPGIEGSTDHNPLVANCAGGINC